MEKFGEAFTMLIACLFLLYLFIGIGFGLTWPVWVYLYGG